MTFMFTAAALIVLLIGNTEGAALLAQLAIAIAIIEAAYVVRRSLTISALVMDRRKHSEKEKPTE